jgi:hypothetical protein
LWGGVPNVEIEQFFFGKLDNDAGPALDFFTNYSDLA